MFFLEFLEDFAVLVADDDVREVLLAQYARIQHLEQLYEMDDFAYRIERLEEDLKEERARTDQMTNYEVEYYALQDLLEGLGVETLEEVGGAFEKLKRERDSALLQAYTVATEVKRVHAMLGMGEDDSEPDRFGGI